MSKGKSKSRRQYYTNIEEYKRRRETLREEYRRKATPLTAKIARWQKQIAIIDGRTIEIEKIIAAIKEFTGYNLYRRGYNLRRNKVEFKAGWWSGATQREKTAYLSICLLAKYGMEASINARFLAEYIKIPRARISNIRRNFTRSFISTPENREKYHNFKQFLLEFQEE